ISISNWNQFPRREISVRRFDPAPVVIVTSGPLTAFLSSAKAAAQRVPLPEISASLPSELKRRVSRPFSEGLTIIHPSPPTPVVRAQIRRAVSGRLAAGAWRAQVRRKSFSAPCSLVNGIFIRTVHGERSAGRDRLSF